MPLRGVLHEGWAERLLRVLGVLIVLGGSAHGDRMISPDDDPPDPAVQQALSQKTDAVHACYYGNIVSTRFSLTVQLTLDAAGRVMQVRVLTHGRFIPRSREECVARTLRGLNLPPSARRRFTYVFKWGADEFPQSFLTR